MTTINARPMHDARNRFLVGFAACLAMATGALAGPTTAMLQAREDFLRANPQAAFYEANPGEITTVYNGPLGVGQSARASADAFVAANAGLFGVDPGDLVPGSIAGPGHEVIPVMHNGDGTYKFTLFSYLQQVNGVPVFRADLRVLVRNEPGYPVVLAKSALARLEDFGVNAAAVTPWAIQTARNNATMRFPGMLRFTAPETIVWAGQDGKPDRARLATTFIGQAFTAASPRYMKQRIVADAVTGQILFTENQIIHFDVSGKATGMATPGKKADPCENEVETPLPYLGVWIAQEKVFADKDGNFLIPNQGITPVVVEAELAGKYFRTHIGSSSGVVAEAQSKSVIPPGSTKFIFNEANNDQTKRGGVNAYYNANVARDFLLAINPEYPTITSQLDWPVNVNVAGTCNAFYDGASINFFLAGDGCPNTAYSDVVWHEYGHHIVNRAGSGQGQYGEGFSDTVGVLISDEPILGYGFQGNCAAGIRTAVNNIQYPCDGPIHDCGQLFSGCVWETRNELLALDPTNYRKIINDLTMNSVLLHQGTLITPQITIDFLTLDDDDGTILNGTPHYPQISKGFGEHNMDAPPLGMVAFFYAKDKPQVIKPSQTFKMPVLVTPVVSSPVPATGKLVYNINGGEFQTVDMIVTGNNEYLAEFPAANCTDIINWYVQVTTTPGAKLATDPSTAPFDTHRTLVAYGLKQGTTTVGFNTGLPSDWSASGLWHVTDQCTPGQISCDGGKFAYFGFDATCNFANGLPVAGELSSSILKVPTVGPPALEFCYRFGVESGPPYDAGEVLINGTPVWQASQNPFWSDVKINLNAYAGQDVQIQFVFDSIDGQLNSNLGWQVDGIRLVGQVADCTKTCDPDCDLSGTLNIDDFICFQTLYAISDPKADCDADGTLNIDDFICFQTLYAIGC
jgi:hypothetical protein